MLLNLKLPLQPIWIGRWSIIVMTQTFPSCFLFQMDRLNPERQCEYVMCPRIKLPFGVVRE